MIYMKKKKSFSFRFSLALLRCDNMVFHVKCCSSTERNAFVWLPSMSRKIYFPISLWVRCDRTRSTMEACVCECGFPLFTSSPKRETLSFVFVSMSIADRIYTQMVCKVRARALDRRAAKTRRARDKNGAYGETWDMEKPENEKSNSESCTSLA